MTTTTPTYTVELTWNEMMELRFALNDRSGVLATKAATTTNKYDQAGYEVQEQTVSNLWNKLYKLMEQQ